MRIASILQVGGLDVKGVIAIAWSPKGGLMQTFERPDREKGNAHKNLKVGHSRSCGRGVPRFISRCPEKTAVLDDVSPRRLAAHSKPNNAIQIRKTPNVALYCARSCETWAAGRCCCSFFGKRTARAPGRPQQSDHTINLLPLYVHTQLCVDMQLWDLGSGEVLLQLFQKAYNKDAWPAIQLAPEEDLAFHAQPNGVNVYDPRDFAAGEREAQRAMRLCMDERMGGSKTRDGSSASGSNMDSGMQQRPCPCACFMCAGAHLPLHNTQVIPS